VSLVIVELERPEEVVKGRLSLVPLMDAVAQALHLLGHEVVRWHRSEILPDIGASHVFWWGCNVPRIQEIRAKRARMRTVYMEVGWTQEREHYLQMDEQGTGGNASWVDEPLMFTPAGPLAVRTDGDILVCLRYDGIRIATDWRLTPYFSSNIQWVEHLVGCTDLPLRVRPHYASRRDRTNLILRRFNRRVTLDRSKSFSAAILMAKAVAVIDSTCGAQAMEVGLPVLCFGRQVFRQPGAVYCLTNEEEPTRQAFTELKEGRCSLDRGAVDAMLAKIWSHQWPAWNVESLAHHIRQRFAL